VLVWLAIRLLWIHNSKERERGRSSRIALDGEEEENIGWRRDEKKAVVGREEEEVASTETEGGDLVIL